MNFWEKVLRFFGLLDEEETGAQPHESAAKTFKGGKIVAFPAPETSYRMVISKPVGFTEVEEIGGHLQNKRPVVVNLEGMEHEEAKRMIDFLSGVIFALNGNSQKVNPHIFIFVPFGVTIDYDPQGNLNLEDIFHGGKKEFLGDELFKK
jgi:cell division inhibitor SepF